MQAMIEWASHLYDPFPMLFMGIWGRFAYAFGLVLVACAFGGFTLRPGGRWGLGREHVRWDTRALLSVVVTIVLVMGSGYLGASIVLVPGAQTLESLKDAMVFVCIVLFGYPALFGAVIAYVLSDMIEGVAPSLMWRWAECMLMIAAYQWIAYQFIGKDPDFRKLRTWAWYALFVFVFMVFYPPLWGYACGPRSGVFPPEISYYKIAPAVFFTFAITWLIAPLIMLAALPLARRFRLYWAEIPGRVRERLLGSREWVWESGAATPAASPGGQGLPIRLLIAVPFVALVLLMVGLVAFLSLRNGEEATRRLAERVGAEITRNITSHADRVLAANPGAEARRAALNDLLREAGVEGKERAFILDRQGNVLASSEGANGSSAQTVPVIATTLQTLRRQGGRLDDVTAPRSLRFDIVAMDPFGGESWHARLTPFRAAGSRETWWVVTALPASSFLGPIQEGSSQAGVVITIALIVAVLLAALLADRVTTPLRRIARTAQAMGRGDLALQAPGSGLEEVESLAATFNHMVRRLQDAFAEAQSGERKLRAVLDISPLPISWANRNGMIEFWNRKAYELFGYAPAQIDTLDKWFVAAYPDPDYRAHVLERWGSWESQKEGETRRGEYRITCADGRIITVEIISTRLGDLMLAVFNDVTERKRNEEALRQLSERLQLATRAAGIGIWDWDVPRNELVWDDDMYRLYGIGREDFAGAYEAWTQALHPDDRERVEARIQAALRGEKEYQEEFRIIRPDGSTRYLQAWGRTSFDTDGKPSRMVGVNYEVTDRKLAEAELLRHRDHLEDLVVARTVQLQRILLLSDQALELTRAGYWSSVLGGPSYYVSSRRCAEILGDLPAPEWKYELSHWRSCIEAIDPAIADQVAEAYRKACAGETPYYDAIYPYLRPVDGRVVWIHALGVVDKDPSSGMPEMFGVVQDITDIFEARRELEEARAAAEAANRAKSLFLANMSHEIRTPMNAILGMSHLALRGSDDPQQRDYLEKIQRAGQHLLNVINDILDISKIEAGKLAIEHAHFPLAALLEDVSNVIADKAAAKGLRLSFEVAPGVPPHLIGDRLRLGQVLINFATNAVKFTEQGGVRICVAAEYCDEHQAVLQFAVHDTGVGLSEEQVGLIFDAFAQGDSSTTRRYGGTGLGLAISKNLVRLMGGEVGVDSEPESGSTFWFTVTLDVGQAGEGLAKELRGCRVLVAENDADTGKSLSTILAGMGFAVATVRRSDEAMVAFRESLDYARAFDIVLLDLEAMGQAGYTLAERIRALSPQHAQSLVLVSSGDAREPVEQAKRAGFPVLYKPIAPSSLFDTVVRLLAAMGRTTSLPAVPEPSFDALRGARVLLVEDNEFNQEVARAILLDAGVEVDVAGDGEAALRRVRSARYDAVLMDVQMPVMDGITATREMRRMSECSGLPIVAMTANVMQEDSRRCMEAGMDDFVAKPVDPDHLLAVLARWIKPREPA